VAKNLTNMLSAFHLVKTDALRHYLVRTDQIYGILADSELALRGRGKRVIWGDGWS